MNTAVGHSPYEYEYECERTWVPQGWQCPQCGRIYSPSVTECEYCNKGRWEYTHSPWTVHPYTWEDNTIILFTDENGEVKMRGVYEEEILADD